MLKKYIFRIPLTRFLLIEDNFHESGQNFITHIIQNHLTLDMTQVHYFVFEGSFARKKIEQSGVVYHDFTSDPRNWLNESIDKPLDFEEIVCKLPANAVVIVDSLAHAIFQYDFPKLYSILNTIVKKTKIRQLVGVLHTDLIEDVKYIQFLEHLSTLSCKLDDCKVQYVYKKLSGKIVRNVEKYKFESGKLVTEPIEKFDPSKVLEQHTAEEVIPDKLTTFKISLDENDKRLRDKLVLPYLPKESGDDDREEGGKISYQFDNFDDWDEEDPDDDLNI